jgi:hypothetical protein
MEKKSVPVLSSYSIRDLHQRKNSPHELVRWLFAQQTMKIKKNGEMRVCKNHNNFDLSQRLSGRWRFFSWEKCILLFQFPDGLTLKLYSRFYDGLLGSLVALILYVASEMDCSRISPFTTMFTLIHCLLAYVEYIRTLHSTLPTTSPMVLLHSAFCADPSNRLAQTKFFSKLGVVFVASYPFL